MSRPERKVTAATLRAREMMQGALVSAHVVGLTIIGLSLALDGVDGLLTSALGFAAVIIFYAVGQALEVIATELEPMRGLGLVLTSYAVRVIGIAAGLWGILSLKSIAHRVIDGWLVAAVAGTVVAWVTGVVLVASRQRVPVFDSEYQPPAEDDETP